MKPERHLRLVRNDELPPLLTKTCFDCVFYDVGSYCELFEEEIDSEIYAARDCSAFQPEGNGHG